MSIMELARQYWTRADGQKIPLGAAVRGTIGKYYVNGVLHTESAIIYRIRPGNGFYGSTLGKVYKDQYAYFAHWPTGNPAAQNGRDAMIAGNAAWKLLSAEEQAAYNQQAAENARHSGRIVFVAKYIKENA